MSMFPNNHSRFLEKLSSTRPFDDRPSDVEVGSNKIVPMYVVQVEVECAFEF